MNVHVPAVSRSEAIPGLTGLRGIGALWVLLFHWAGLRQWGREAPVLGFGYLGVDLFFLLSGFVLTHVYLRRLSLDWASYRQFLLLRFARIYPLYASVLLAFAAAILLIPGL